MSCNVRVLNACVNTDCLDIESNNMYLAKKCSYNYLSDDYTTLNHGDHYIKVYKTDKKHYPILNAYTKFPQDSYHTIVASGIKDDINLFVVPDAHYPINSTKAYIRFVNLSPDAEALDFRFTDDGFIMVNDVRYKETTQYYPATPDTYTVRVYLAGTNIEVLEVPHFTLRRGRVYTIYILGSVHDLYSMRYKFSTDGRY
ncbi:MAG: DUF4397 domain-containing protein [Peptococcaceae bacterium]